MNFMRNIIPCLILLIPAGSWANQDLSLDEAIQVTLENSFAFRIASLDPEIARHRTRSGF